MKPWPTELGKAVLIGVAYSTFIGLTQRAVAFGPAIALLAIMWIDGFLALRLIGRAEVTVTTLRRVGTSADQPSVLLRQTGGVTNLMARLRPISQFDPESPWVSAAAPGGVVLTYSGNHPVARSFVAYETSVSALGLVRIKTTYQQPVAGLICRGPDPGAQSVDVPTMNAADDISRLREYVPGDRMSRVNWQATARTTRLHVRDEQPMLDEVVVVLLLVPEAPDSLPQWSDGVERIKTTLSLTRMIGEDVLAEGRSLRLVTTELSGILESAAMASAKLIDKQQPKPRADYKPTLVDGYITDRSELLRRLSMAEPTDLVPTIRPPYVRVTLSNVTIIP